MSLSRTKERLTRLLEQSDNSVIALSGKWGTGKTHLWNEIKAASVDQKIKNSFYVSLFGLSSVDQAKRRLLESAVPSVESHGGLLDGIKNAVSSGVTALSEHFKAMAAIKDLNVALLAPVVLRDKLIVIDDIERKHAKLGIDEVLGFIDDFSKQFRVRFVLVLNDDRLSTDGDQAKLWATFREKVIDEEIRLSTSAREAFSIAIKLAPSSYAQAIERACVACGLTNIRVVGKVVKAANRILAGRDLDEAVQSRVIPPIVLFAAIHYRGLDDGPDFQFALNIGSAEWASLGRDRGAEPTEQEKREDRWRMLMQDAGVDRCGEFEKVLVEFFESGLFESDDAQALVDRYVAETRSMQARGAARAFVARAFWDHRAKEADLLAEASNLVPNVGLLDPYEATALFDALREIQGGEGLGQSMVDAWVAAFVEGDRKGADETNPFNNRIHPDMQAAFDSATARVEADATVVDACMHIVENSGWGALQEVALKRATAADFETAIREMDIEKLRRFMRRMIEMRLQRDTYDAHFGSATQHFMDACRDIADDRGSPRLARLIKKLFAATALAPELESARPPAQTPADRREATS